MVKGKKVTTITAGTELVVKKLLIVSTRDLTKYVEQSGSKQVGDDKKVIVPANKSRKAAMTTMGIKPTRKKL